MAALDSITLLSPLDQSRPGKTLTPTGPSGAAVTKPAYLWRAGRVPISGPTRLFHVLERAAQDGHWIAVRGEPLPGVNLGELRRTHVNEPTLGEQARRWLMLDLDKHRPDLDMCAISAQQAAELARQDLPAPFQSATCWFQATSNARVKPGLRLRLAFWLDRPLTNEQVKAWADTWQVSVDRSIYTPSQPHFLAPPTFQGMPDPYQDEPRSGVLEGQDEVVVPHDPTQAHSAQAELDKECRALRRAEEGERRNRLNSAAFRLASKFSQDELPLHQIREALERAASAVGLSGTEISLTLSNALRDGQAKYQSSRSGWRAKLARDKEGQVKSTAANVSLFFEHHPAFAGLAFDDRSGLYAWLEPPPWPWRDSESDVPSAQEWFQEHAGIDATVQAVRDGILKASKARRFDPIVQYLDGLPAWDGQSRVETFFARHLGVQDTPLTRAQTKAWLVQAVRRAYATMEKPVKADYVIGLWGPQGLGKSSVCAALCPQARFFTDSLPPLDKADAKAAVADSWIVELAELPQRRAEQDLLKAFLSARHDTFRRPYRRDAETVARKCVQIATVNHGDFLTDPTGNRRFWPMECTRKADPAEAEAERDQLWAEAKLYAERGDQTYLPDELEAQARLVQDEHLEEHPIELKVARVLSEPTAILDPAEGQLGPDRRLRWISVLDLAELVGADKDVRALSRVKRALKRAGWREKRLTQAALTSRVWARPKQGVLEDEPAYQAN